MKFRKLVSALLIAAMALSLAACGSAAGDSAPAEEAVEAGVEEAEDAEAEDAETEDAEAEDTEAEETETPAELTKIKVSEAPRALYFLPMYAAVENGYFEEEGIDLEIISTSAGPEATQALVTGEAQFCAIGNGQAANLLLQGEAVKIINEMENKITFYAVGKTGGEEVTEISDLAGKKIGVTGAGAETDGLIRYLLIKAGLDPDKDVTIEGVGGMSNMATALDSGAVDVIMTWEPLVTQLLQSGEGYVIAKFNTDEDSQKYLDSPYYSFSVVEVLQSYIDENPEMVQAFSNAMVKGEKWLQENDIETIAELASKYFDMEHDVLIQALESEFTAYSADGTVPEEGHNTAIRVFKESGLMSEDVAFEDLVDNSFALKSAE